MTIYRERRKRTVDEPKTGVPVLGAMFQLLIVVFIFLYFAGTSKPYRREKSILSNQFALGGNQRRGEHVGGYLLM